MDSIPTVCVKREVSSLPLSQYLIDKLISCGFRFVDDLKDMRCLELTRELQCDTNTACNILQLCQDQDSSIVKNNFTALDAVQHASMHRPIISFCKQLDKALGGGIPISQITELVGLPGTGKTQFCIQLALDVQIPEYLRGSGGEALYIDTEGSFMPERAYEMASALTSHLTKLISRQNFPQNDNAYSSPTPESFLKGIHVFRAHDQIELSTIIHMMPQYLREQNNRPFKPKIKLIIIDSMAFPFRQNLLDANRARILSTLAQILNKCAIDHSLAVVLVNHMTTKIDRSGGRASIVLPALGEQWSHFMTHRVMLEMHEGNRLASIVKSTSRPFDTTVFAITSMGIRDVIVAKPNDDVEHDKFNQEKKRKNNF